ncbi:Fic family protein [Bosea caraganae]|nr:Fic family protein [Bosea caraganae]
MSYLQTHPWLSFTLDLRQFNHSLWMLLGEARSKCAHLSSVPMRPEIADRLHRVYLAKGIHATTAIEGNTLSEKQVLEIIENKKDEKKSERYLRTEIDNVLHSANKILESVEKYGFKPITATEIKSYNKQILENLDTDEHVTPGEFSPVQVGVPRYKGAAPSDFATLVTKLCDWLNSDFAFEDEELAVPFGLIKAIVSHVYLVWIHPFGDGNGRTARMLEVRFLLEANVPSVAAHLLSNHYNRTRDEYYRQLDRASKNGGNLVPFIEYAIQGFIDQMRDQIKVIKQQLWDISWINYVYDKFGEDKTPSDRRQLKLILALGNKSEHIERPKLRLLTPEIAAEYAVKTSKTLSRDIGKLKSLGLISETKEGVRAKKEILLAFLPRSKPGNAERQLEEALKMKSTADQLTFEF